VRLPTRQFYSATPSKLIYNIIFDKQSFIQDMSLVTRSIKEFGFDHQFSISALYLEKDNNISFAGIYKSQDRDYFCINGSKFGFIYFPLDIIIVSRLIKGEISLIKLVLENLKL